MATFPTLTDPDTSLVVQPSFQNYQKSKTADPTLRWRLANGYRKTRLQQLVVGNVFQILFLNIHDDLMRLIETFEQTEVYYGTTVFTWTDPVTTTAYQVYFGDVVQYTLVNGIRWDVQFTLEEEK